MSKKYEADQVMHEPIHKLSILLPKTASRGNKKESSNSQLIFT